MRYQTRWLTKVMLVCSIFTACFAGFEAGFKHNKTQLLLMSQALQTALLAYILIGKEKEQ